MNFWFKYQRRIFTTCPVTASSHGSVPTPEDVARGGFPLGVSCPAQFLFGAKSAF